MSPHKALLIFATIAQLLIAGRSLAYEIPNHADMSRTALEKSILAANANEKLFKIGLKKLDVADNNQRFPLPSSLPAIPMCFGVVRDSNGAMVANTALGVQPPWNTDSGRTVLSIANLIRYGACYEDNEGALLLTNQRPIAHFYDPQRSGAAIRSGEPSSPDWMLLGATGTVAGSNHFGWADARAAFYDALTYKSDLASVSAADNEVLRKLQWAKTFQSIGHLIHHLQDMAQPQHVRSDDHCDAAQCAAVPGLTYKPSGYEKHLLNNRLEFVQTLAASASAPIMFGLPREFWSLQGNSVTGHYPSNQGIAAYTATNFVSAGTNFRREFNGAVYVTAPDPTHPFPQPASQTNDVSLTTLYANAPQSTLDIIKNTLCNGNATTCYMKFLGTNADPSARTAATSIFSPELLNPSNTYVGDRLLGPYTQNYWTYDDAATKLVPRAVEYSAGLINYFFRGEMEISLPEEGVYGLLDHAVEKTKGVDGFRLIKMKVKNTTADINTALGTTAQHMSAGEFRAVAKFHRNTCYHPQLTGQIGTISKGDGTVLQANTVELCRSATEEIVVSSVEPNVSELAAGVTVPMVFDFPNAIPIEATDLTIQVVFKGTLGAEVGAVAVTTRDISEPTFFTYANTNDYRLTPTGAILPYTDENSLAYASSYFSGLGGWMGFARNDAAIRITKLPVAGLRAGTFSRIALLADTQQPVVPGQVGDASSEWFVGGTLVYQPNLAPLGPADVPVWSFVGESTVAPSCKLAHLQDGSEGPCSYLRRIAATRMQQTEDGTYGTLPTYWSMRGLVLAYDQNRTGNQNFLSALVERRFTAQPPSNTETATSTRLNDYPIFVSLDPVPMAEIRFARAAANRVTMSDAAWAAERLQQSPVCAWLGYEQYCKQIIWHPAGVMSE
jgi:hypothetical protein